MFICAARILEKSHILYGASNFTLPLNAPKRCANCPIHAVFGLSTTDQILNLVFSESGKWGFIASIIDLSRSCRIQG